MHRSARGTVCRLDSVPPFVFRLRASGFRVSKIGAFIPKKSFPRSPRVQCKVSSLLIYLTSLYGVRFAARASNARDHVMDRYGMWLFGDVWCLLPWPVTLLLVVVCASWGGGQCDYLTPPPRSWRIMHAREHWPRIDVWILVLRDVSRRSRLVV